MEDSVCLNGQIHFWKFCFWNFWKKKFSFFFFLERRVPSLDIQKNDTFSFWIYILHVLSFILRCINLVTSESFVGADLSTAPALAHGWHSEAFIISFLTAVSRLVIIKILAVSDVGIAQPIAGSVDRNDRALAPHIPQGSSLCTWISRAAVLSGNQLITQRGSATITLGRV